MPAFKLTKIPIRDWKMELLDSAANFLDLNSLKSLLGIESSHTPSYVHGAAGFKLTKIPIRDWKQVKTPAHARAFSFKLTKIPIRDWKLFVLDNRLN